MNIPIVAVNSLAEKDTNTAERQPDERLQNTISTAVVKAVQDLLEARQRKFEEADKGKMTINEILQEILGQYDDICGKAKGFYQIYQGAMPVLSTLTRTCKRLAAIKRYYTA